MRADLAGSPAPLRTLHSQANQLLGGGVAAFKARLAGLRGYPVVVNRWAEWCGPCRSEFPVYQRVSLQLGRRVAFVGLDGNDFAGPARSFLRRYPVSYPSYMDPRSEVAGAFNATFGFPLTIFFTPAGKQVYVHAGPYLNAAALVRDIRFYVLR